MSDWSQPAMFDDPHARRSDPTSSHVVVDTIAEWSSLNDALLRAFDEFGDIPFDDTDLTNMITHTYGRPVQRNVVARARGLLEREGHLTRLGQRQRDGRCTVHFRSPRAGDPQWGPEPAPKVLRIEASALVGAHERDQTTHAGLTLVFNRPTDRDVAWRSIQKQMGWSD
jgi:hypothetical protein